MPSVLEQTTMLFRSRSLFYARASSRWRPSFLIRRQRRRVFGVTGGLLLLRGALPPAKPTDDDLREAQKILMLAAIGLD